MPHGDCRQPRPGLPGADRARCSRESTPESAPADDTSGIRVAIIGRPNVGKSTLVNRLIGEERVIASEQPGTTRDSILVPFQRDGREFLFVDTAGVRRRARVEDPIERASVARTLQAIAGAHVVILVLDAHDNVGEQDASVLGQALDRGRVYPYCGQQMGRHCPGAARGNQAPAAR